MNKNLISELSKLKIAEAGLKKALDKKSFSKNEKTRIFNELENVKNEIKKVKFKIKMEKEIKK